MRSGFQADIKTLLAASTRQPQSAMRVMVSGSLDEQSAATGACNQAKLQVQEVLEFFGQEKVAQVVETSPKLSEPKG